MRKIYNYIGLFGGLFFSLASYGQNMVTNPGFEAGCPPTGFSSDMYLYPSCSNYSNWSADVSVRPQGQYTIYSGNSDNILPSWTATPHAGNYFFVGDGVWANSLDCGEAAGVEDGSPPPPNIISNITSNRAWYTNFNVYEGLTYVFSTWYYNQQPGNMGEIQLQIKIGGVFYNSSPSSSIYGSYNDSSSSNINATGWKHMFYVFTAPPSSTNPYQVEADIIVNYLTTACSDIFNDFALDDVYFGPICNPDGNAGLVTYQNTSSLPPLTQADVIDAGSNVNPNQYTPASENFTTGNVTVQSGQSITFQAGVQVNLAPGFIVNSNSNFIAEIVPVTGLCETVRVCIAGQDCPPEGYILVERQSTPRTNSTTNYEFNVYPNPTSGNVTIDFNYSQSQPVQVKLFDLFGEQIFSENLGAIQIGRTVVDLNSQPSGIYIVQVSSGSTVTTKKIILEK